MSIVKEYSFPSVSELGDIYVRCWLPEDGKVKAVFQMAHGMAEHCDRYNWFAEKLCDAGYAVFINNHLGHKGSVKNDDMLGFFGEKDGWLNLVEDMRKTTELAKKEFPDLPFIVFGHSMGSFICRAYTSRYTDIDAAIYCGTGGPNPAAAMGIAVANTIGKVKGVMYRSPLIDKMAFGTYNKRCPKRTPFDWLTKDEEIVDKYIDDKYCGFMFTTAGYRDLFSALGYVSKTEWAERVPEKLPILIVSGAEDPVGTYGEGVKKVYEMLKVTGHNDVEMKLYEGDRHEILNELDRDTVAADIIAFADKYATK